MNTRGTVTSRRRSCTRANTWSVVTPPRRARRLASWITGPSAVGSEKGMPSSIRSAPLAAIARTVAAVVSRSGSPQVRKGMKAFPWAKAAWILSYILEVLPSIAGDGRAVLVPPPGEGDDDALFLPHGGGQLPGIGHRV